MGSLIVPRLPIVDFSKGNLMPGTSDWLSTSNEVRHALEEYGCFIAKYDKVPLQLHNEMFDLLEALFNLPQETKISNTHNERAVGYFPPRPSMPLFEGFSLENAITLEGTKKFTDTMWPNGNDNFCEIALSHSKLLLELYRMVARMVFESYGVEKYYDSHVASIDHHLGFVKYRAPRKNELNVGRRVHMDKSFVDLLDQNLVKGLEVETKDGEWIAFEPAPSHFVILAGEAFKAWSNGRIQSPYHRVIIRGNEAKYTIGLVSYVHGMVQAPEELVDDDHPLLFKPFTHFEYLQSCLENANENPKYCLKDYCGI